MILEKQVPVRGYLIRGVDFPDEGTIFVSGWSDNVARTWDVRTGEVQTVFAPRCPDGHACGLPTRITFSEDGKLVATGSVYTRLVGSEIGQLDHDVHLFDAATGRELRRLQGHEDLVFDVEFLPGGEKLVSASRDGTVRLWEVETGKQLAVYAEHAATDDNAQAVAVSPDGRRIVSGDISGQIVIRDLISGETSTVAAGGPGVMDVAYSPDGEHIATGGGDIVLRSVPRGEEVPRVFRRDGMTVSSVVFSPDGQYLAAALSRTLREPQGRMQRRTQSVIRVYRVADGSSAFESAPIDSYLVGLAFSPDGERLVASGKDGIYIWDLLPEQESP